MSIRYDEYVKKPGEQLQFDLNMIQELESSSRDIFEFVKHIKIVSLDKGRINFDPYIYQKEMIEMFRDYRKIVILASRQSGKCVCANSMISVRNKKTGEIEEISIKDFFDRFDEDNKGDKNPAYNHKGKYSPFSKSFVKYEGMTNEEIEKKMFGVYL